MDLILPLNRSIDQSPLKLGLNTCSNEVYHSDRVFLSSSVYKTLLKSLDDYRMEYLEGKKKEHSERTLSNFAEGSLTHSMLLEPEVTASEFAFYPGFRKQGAEYEAFKAENSKKTIISAPQKERVDKLVNAALNHKEAVDLLTGGVAEQTLACVLNGVPTKVRADKINAERSFILDVKTTGYESDLDSFKQTVKDFRYDLSAALYLQAFEEFYGRRFDFYFIVLSKQSYTCDVYKLSDASRQAGYRDILKAAGKFRKAATSGIWTESEPDSSPNPGSNSPYTILEV